MKKNVLLAAALAVGVLGLGNTNAQIELLRTFETRPWYNDQYDVRIYATNSNPVKIYNEDFSLRKSVYLDLPDGYSYLYFYNFSEKIFNTDDKLEFLVEYNPSNGLRLYNEDGVMLKDFGGIYSHEIHCTSNGEYRLTVVKNNSITEVYKLPGRGNIATSIAKKATELAYKLRPGETATMKIYDARGRLIDTKQVDYVFSKILLNTTNYSRGVYVYEINGLAKKFTVK